MIQHPQVGLWCTVTVGSWVVGAGANPIPAIVMKASAAAPIPDLETFSKAIIKLHMLRNKQVLKGMAGTLGLQ